MKALKATIGIIVIGILIIVGIYLIVYICYGIIDDSPAVQEIMDENKKEKADFESKIAEIESREKASNGENLLLKKEIVKANERTGKADAARGDWKKKYDESKAEYEKIKETNKPKNEAEFKALNEEQKVIEYGKLKINLDVTESRLKKCETGLNKNKALLIEYKATLNLQASQIKNFGNGMALKIEKIATLSEENDRLNITVSDLYKAKKPAWWRYAAAFFAGFAIASIK